MRNLRVSNRQLARVAILHAIMLAKWRRRLKDSLKSSLPCTGTVCNKSSELIKTMEDEITKPTIIYLNSLVALKFIESFTINSAAVLRCRTVLGNRHTSFRLCGVPTWSTKYWRIEKADAVARIGSQSIPLGLPKFSNPLFVILELLFWEKTKTN